MENMAFRKFEWSVWKLLDWRILHQIPKGFWEPWATPKPPAVSNEPPSENFCLRAWILLKLSRAKSGLYIIIYQLHQILKKKLLMIVCKALDKVIFFPLHFDMTELEWVKREISFICTEAYCYFKIIYLLQISNMLFQISNLL